MSPQWAALLGAFIGAAIPSSAAVVRAWRDRQWATAEVLGPALLVLEELDPDRRMINVRSPEQEEELWTEFRSRVRAARERLLVISAGHPRPHIRSLAASAAALLGNIERDSWLAVRDLLRNKDNPNWVERARQTHEQARQALRGLIEATFSAWRRAG